MAIPIPVFHGRISADGRFELAEQERGLRQAYFKNLAGQSVEIVVRKERTKRSLNQNAYWHAIPFPLLAENLGYDSIDELKYDLMGECWGWTRSKAGHDIPAKIHTSDLTIDEGSYFTEWLVRFGAQLPSPCLIPLPNEAEAA